MERLTRYIGSRAASAGDMGDLKYVRLVIDRLAAYEDTGFEPSEMPTGLELANVFAALQELKQYKDAEKQGLLVRLPCAVGDMVYIPVAELNIAVPSKVTAFVCSNDLCDVSKLSFVLDYRNYNSHNVKEFGKTVFLTRSEAEVALGGELGG